jgi:magnesium-transporting ATPase (P-type)
MNKLLLLVLTSLYFVDVTLAAPSSPSSSSSSSSSSSLGWLRRSLHNNNNNRSRPKPTARTTNYYRRVVSVVSRGGGGSSSSSGKSSLFGSGRKTKTKSTTAGTISTTTDGNYLLNGLSSTKAKQLLEIYGKNELMDLPPPSYYELVQEQFEDQLVRILVFVAILSALLEYSTSSSGNNGGSITESIWHRFAEPVVISSLLIINAVVGVWQSKSASGSIEALKALQPNICTVIRNNGTEYPEYPSCDLVVGDLIILKTGDKIPADSRLVSYYKGRRTLMVDEASLTGESISVEKLICDNNNNDEDSNHSISNHQLNDGMCYSGTTIVNGGGIAIVVATGSQTEFGKIQSGVLDAKKNNKNSENKTPLTKQLDEFGNQLTKLIGLICGLVWMASIPKMSSQIFNSKLEGIIYYTKVAVALGVAAIPEGLPAVITLCLSLGTRRMAQRNVIVRHLPSVETLGCVSVICSDKTGTLTTNEMTVISLLLFDQQNQNQKKNNKNNKNSKNASSPSCLIEHTIDGVSYSPIGKINDLVFDKYDKELYSSSGSINDVIAVSSLCNDARIIGNNNNNNNDNEADGKSGKNKNNQRQRQYERTGEPTEAALCILAEKIGTASSSASASPSSSNDSLPLKQQQQQQQPSELASYYVDKFRSTYDRIATLEFHRDRKSKFQYNISIDTFYISVFYID